MAVALRKERRWEIELIESKVSRTWGSAPRGAWNREKESRLMHKFLTWGVRALNGSLLQQDIPPGGRGRDWGVEQRKMVNSILDITGSTEHLGGDPKEAVSSQNSWNCGSKWCCPWRVFRAVSLKLCYTLESWSGECPKTTRVWLVPSNILIELVSSATWGYHCKSFSSDSHVQRRLGTTGWDY